MFTSEAVLQRMDSPTSAQARETVSSSLGGKGIAAQARQSFVPASSGAVGKASFLALKPRLMVLRLVCIKLLVVV